MQARVVGRFDNYLACSQLARPELLEPGSEEVRMLRSKPPAQLAPEMWMICVHFSPGRPGQPEPDDVHGLAASIHKRVENQYL